MTANALTEWAMFMRATGAAVATIRLRTETIEQLMRHAGKTDPLTLTRRDVLAYMARDVRQWTKVTYFRSIRAWDVWGREFGYIPDSILKGIPSPKTPRLVARPYTDEQIAALLAAPLNKRTRAFVLLALHQALRVHEIAAVTAEQFDHPAGWMLVPGKGGTVDQIPIHPRITELSAEYPEQGYWFMSSQRPGEHVDVQSVSTTIRNALALAGVHGTAHRLRDTAATRMQRQSKDIRLTQAFLRHRSLVNTMKYTEVSNTALQEAVSRITWNAA